MLFELRVIDADNRRSGRALIRQMPVGESGAEQRIDPLAVNVLGRNMGIIVAHEVGDRRSLILAHLAAGGFDRLGDQFGFMGFREVRHGPISSPPPVLIG